MDRIDSGRQISTVEVIPVYNNLKLIMMRSPRPFMGRVLGRIYRILAWLSPVYQFRTALWKKTGVKIGKRVYIGNLTLFDAQYPHLITLEDEVSIGSHVVILAHADGSLYHQRTKTFTKERKPVLIKQGAWITSHSIILPGVTVGKGAIVAAGSVVSRDVPDFTIVAGNPARPVSKIVPPSD